MKVNNTRQENSVRNSIFGIVAQFAHLILSFICRTLLIRKLGAEILGINGLYTDILNLLCLAELGLGNALLVGLYKPLKENDQNKITTLIKYYAKLYNGITLCVFLVGLILLPVLPFIVSNDVVISNRDLYLYYLIFLMNTCLSYVLCYKQTIINADQKNFIIKVSNLIFNIISFSVQILVLMLLPDYKTYLAVAGVFVLSQNIVLNFVANKMYPYLKTRTESGLCKDEKQSIKKNIISIFFYKIGVAILTSTDNILISSLVGTLVVGYYSNYSLLTVSVTSFISIIIHAIYSSVGDLTTENNSEKAYFIFNFLLLLFQYIAVFCTVCLFTLLDDFVLLWLGLDFVLSKDVVVVICLSFYLNIVVTPVWVYRENYALFNQVKYLMLLAAIINIILSIVLGLLWGLFGILISTVVAKLITIYINEPNILFKKIFKKNVSNYFVKQFVCLVICGALSFGIDVMYDVFLVNNFWTLILKVGVNFVLVSVLFTIATFKTKEFKYGISAIKNIFFKLKNGKSKEIKNDKT